MNEQELKLMVEKLLGEMVEKSGSTDIVNEVANKMSAVIGSVDKNGCIPDITEIDLKNNF